MFQLKEQWARSPTCLHAPLTFQKPPNLACTCYILFSLGVFAFDTTSFHFVWSDPHYRFCIHKFWSAILLFTFRSFLQRFPSQKLLAILFARCKKHHLFKVQHSPKSKIVFCKYKIITKSMQRTKLVSATGFPVVVSLLFSHIIN